MVLLCHPLVNEERKRKKETILTSQATNERGALAEASDQSRCYNYMTTPTTLTRATTQYINDTYCQGKELSCQFTCPFGQVQCVFCLSEPQNYLSKNRQPQQY